jgi:hypothetical protein
VEAVPPGAAKGIYFRNLTKDPIRITTISLYDCVNVMGGCESVHPDELIVQAGQTVLGLTLLPLQPRQGFSARFNGGIVDGHSP